MWAATLIGVHVSAGSAASITKASPSIVHITLSWPLRFEATAEPHSMILAAFQTGPGSQPRMSGMGGEDGGVGAAAEQHDVGAVVERRLDGLGARHGHDVAGRAERALVDLGGAR